MSVITPLLLLASLALVVAMPMCQLQGNLAMTTHSLLRDMGGLFPVQCLQEHVSISFPASSFSAAGSSPGSSPSPAPLKCGEVSWAIYETLCGMDGLFEANELPADGNTWDQQKLDDFQNLLYRQVEDGRCLLSGVGGSTTGSEALKAYFTSLAAVLQDKADSMCGWEVVRRELLYALQFILRHNQSCFTWSQRT